MSPIASTTGRVTVEAMSLRRVVDGLLGPDGSGASTAGPDADEARAALDADGHGELPSELYGEALVHFADATPLVQADALRPIVVEASAVPVDPELDPIVEPDTESDIESWDADDPEADLDVDDSVDPDLDGAGLDRADLDGADLGGESADPDAFDRADDEPRPVDQGDGDGGTSSALSDIETQPDDFGAGAEPADASELVEPLLADDGDSVADASFDDQALRAFEQTELTDPLDPFTSAPSDDPDAIGLDEVDGAADAELDDDPTDLLDG